LGFLLQAALQFTPMSEPILFFRNDNVISQQCAIRKDALSPLFTAQHRGMLFTTLTAPHNS